MSSEGDLYSSRSSRPFASPRRGSPGRRRRRIPGPSRRSSSGGPPGGFRRRTGPPRSGRRGRSGPSQYSDYPTRFRDALPRPPRMPRRGNGPIRRRRGRSRSRGPRGSWPGPDPRPGAGHAQDARQVVREPVGARRRRHVRVARRVEPVRPVEWACRARVAAAVARPPRTHVLAATTAVPEVPEQQEVEPAEGLVPRGRRRLQPGSEHQQRPHAPPRPPGEPTPSVAGAPPA